MHRLLQGEVGSGKTVVALRAMLAVVDSGGQAVLLAPTEVLAQQHARSIDALLGPLGRLGELDAADMATAVALVTGSMSAAARREALLDIGVGDAGHRHRHPCAAREHRAVLRPRARGRRRAAPVRCRAARRAARQGSDAAARPGDDRHPDPADCRDDGVRRPRDLDAHRAPGRSAADHDDRRADRGQAAAGSTGSGSARARRSRRAGRSTSCVRGSTRTTPSTADGRPVDADDEPGATVGPALRGRRVAPMLAAGPLSGLRVEVLHGRLAARRQGRGDAAVRRRQGRRPGRDDRDRGRGRRRERHRDGRPRRRALRHLPAAPAARPDRSRRASGRVPAGDRGRGRQPSRESGSTAWQPTLDGFELARLDLEQRREGDVLGESQSGRRSHLKLLRLLRDEDLIDTARDDARALVADDPSLGRSPGSLAAAAALPDDERGRLPGEDLT